MTEKYFSSSRCLVALLALAIPSAAAAGADAAAHTTGAAGTFVPAAGADTTASDTAAVRPEVVRLSRSGSAVRVDGVLEPGEWEGAGRITLPFEVEPAENAPASVETLCRVTFDAESLYLGCLARDPDPASIRAYVTDRDGIDDQDRIEVTLDPFRDARRGFVFAISALGVQSDALFSQQGQAMMGGGDPRTDRSWDTIWRSRGRIHEEGYTVEAAIPFGSLRFPEGAGSRGWGVLISRFRPRSSAVELRSRPLDRAQACVLCQAGELRGLGAVSPGSSVQLSPTLTASRSDAPDPDGPGLAPGPVDGELGLNARWSPTTDLTLNVTANPDFSQIEADAARLEVNQRFALFFPEKRPFFQEGADVFQTPIQALFTRSVVEPVAGVKLTGKLEGTALGALVVRDEVNRLLLPGPQASSTALLESSVTTAVARGRRDVGEASTVGGMAILREGAGYHNRVAGADAFLQPAASVTARLHYLRSWTGYPSEVEAPDQPAGTFSGDAFQGQLRYAGRSWILNSDVRHYGRDFRADAGFVSQVGFRGGNASVQRRFWGGSDRWFTRLSGQVGTWRNEEVDGALLNGGVWLGLRYVGPKQLRGNWFTNVFREGFAGETYDDMVNHFFQAGIQPSGAVTLGLTGQVGDALDVANARKADQLLLRPSVDLRLGRRTTVGLGHTFQRLQLPEDGRRIFSARLSELRVVYNFDTRTFVRAIVQHRRTDRDPAVWSAAVPSRETGLFTQLLFSYKANPQTVIFLGYTDDRGGTAEAPTRRVSLDPRGRTFFLKLGYAWRP